MALASVSSTTVTRPARRRDPLSGARQNSPSSVKDPIASQGSNQSIKRKMRNKAQAYDLPRLQVVGRRPSPVAFVNWITGQASRSGTHAAISAEANLRK